MRVGRVVGSWRSGPPGFGWRDIGPDESNIRSFPVGAPDVLLLAKTKKSRMLSLPICLTPQKHHDRRQGILKRASSGLLLPTYRAQSTLFGRANVTHFSNFKVWQRQDSKHSSHIRDYDV